MTKPLEIKAQEQSMRTIVSLTSAFESLSSMKIMQTKGKVLQSNQFFDDVWNIYKQVRVDVMFNFGREENEVHNGREVLILIMAPAGLMGDIDQRLIRKFREYYDASKHDVIVIGKHGAQQLDQIHIKYDMYFDLPTKDYINVDPLLVEIKKYSKSRVFYQDYISLTQQAIRSIDVSEAISMMGQTVDTEAINDNDKITEKNYIFEPTSYAVAAHLETSIVRLMLSQFIYDSRLAQLASRFRAMSAARERSVDTANTLHTQYNRAKRAIVDVRLRESLVALKKIRTGGD
jgi:ATP synthase F1 gamma subunit